MGDGSVMLTEKEIGEDPEVLVRRGDRRGGSVLSTCQNQLTKGFRRHKPNTTVKCSRFIINKVHCNYINYI